MTKIEKTKLTAMAAALSLATASQAATIVYSTDTVLTTGESDTGNIAADVIGFQVTSGATLTISTGGSLTHGDQPSSQTTLLLGTTDGSASGNLVMNAGSSITGSEVGGNSITGIAAYGSSIATINGGTITVNEIGNPEVADNSVAFRAFGSSKFVLNGGSFVVTENGAGSITPFTVSDSAIVEINGGTWSLAEDNSGSVLGLNLTSAGATVKLNGTFNFGLGNIDEETDTGTITGTLSNGDAFSMGFDKTLGGTITIIPEPRAALLGGIGLIALLRRRRN